VSHKMLKIVCSYDKRGDRHKEVLIGRLSYRGEDVLYTPEPEHFAPGDPRRNDEPIVLRAGVTLRGGLLREERPEGGTKARAKCRRCRADLPLSWETINRGAVIPRLLEEGAPKVELRRLIQLNARIRAT
jgi:hypothetical protein